MNICESVLVRRVCVCAPCSKTDSELERIVTEGTPMQASDGDDTQGTVHAPNKYYHVFIRMLPPCPHALFLLPR